MIGRVAMAWACAALAAACSYSSKVYDPTGAFACYGSDEPPSVPANVTISGSTIDERDAQPVEGVTVSGFLDGDSAPIFSIASGSAGAFSVTHATGGVPREAYLTTSASGYLPTTLTLGAPLAADLNVTVPIFTNDDLASLGSAAGQTLDPTKVQGIVAAFDCNDAPLAGVTVSTEPAPGKVVYLNETTGPDPAQTATDSTGIAFIYNLAPGTITIDGTVDGVDLLSHTATATTTQIMVAFLQPGP